MRIELNEAGKIVCTMDGANHEFLSDCQYSLKGFDGKGRLQFVYFGDGDKDKWSYPEVGEEIDYLTLSDMLESAKINGVEVDEEVIEICEKWRKTYNRCEIRRKIEEEERERAKNYDIYCSRGCTSCQYCEAEKGDDIFVCKYSGVVLPEKMGAWANAYVYLPFRGVPFPSEGCKYQGDRRNG